jgi:thiol-disulfide isomerase/thioredoxin
MAGIYFWRPQSPPCREFTQHLKNVYKHYQEKGEKFEILFLISETLMYKVYNDTMPWAGIVCAGSRRSALTAKFKIATV